MRFALDLGRGLSYLVSRGCGDSHLQTKAGHQELRTLHVPTSGRSRESIEGFRARNGVAQGRTILQAEQARSPMPVS